MVRVPPVRRNDGVNGIYKRPAAQGLSTLFVVSSVYGYFVQAVPVHVVQFLLRVFAAADNDCGIRSLAAVSVCLDDQ